jgi:ribosomal protein L28
MTKNVRIKAKHKGNITFVRRNKANKISIERNKTTKFTPRNQKSNLQVFRDPSTGITINTDKKTIRTIWKYGGLKGFFEKTKRGKLTLYGKKLRNKMVSFAN